jgi:1-deoxy-D-xylulose-5-phosphate reductoisomerase
VTPKEACKHPNCFMGRKIFVDSATMMSKGLGVIEAHWLFGLPRERIDVLIHPQSVIHPLFPTQTARCSLSSAIRTCARRLPTR